MAGVGGSVTTGIGAQMPNSGWLYRFFEWIQVCLVISSGLKSLCVARPGLTSHSAPWLVSPHLESCSCMPLHFDFSPGYSLACASD